MTRTVWSRAEDQRLCARWSGGVTCPEIAAELTGRSPNAVKLRLRWLRRRGIVTGRRYDREALDAVHPAPAHERLAERVADLWMDGLTTGQIAAAVGYSSRTVSLALAALRETGELGHAWRPWTAPEIAQLATGRVPRGRTPCAAACMITKARLHVIAKTRRRDAVAAAYAEGWSLKRIASAVGLSVPGVSQVLAGLRRAGRIGYRRPQPDQAEHRRDAVEIAWRQGQRPSDIAVAVGLSRARVNEIVAELRA